MKTDAWIMNTMALDDWLEKVLFNMVNYLVYVNEYIHVYLLYTCML